MLNSVTVFECNTCKRRVEIVLDPKRPNPVRCSITYKCPGKYTKVKTKNSKSFLFTPIITGVQDYIPRGTPIPEIIPEPINPLISLLAGSDQLVLAATYKKNNYIVDNVREQDGISNPDGTEIIEKNIFPLPESGHPDRLNFNTLTLELYELDTNVTEFTEFYFIRKINTRQIAGIDDSDNNLMMRFQAGVDTIKVFVNGVEWPQYDDTVYQDKYFTAGSSAVENYITFQPALSGTSNTIKILVQKPLLIKEDSSKIKRLVFSGLDGIETARTTNSWGDTTAVSVSDVNSSELDLHRFLYTSSGLRESGLNFNYRYIIRRVASSGAAAKYLDLKDVHLLFAKDPYSYVDKVSDLSLNLQTAIDNSAILQFYEDPYGNANLFVDKDHITNLVEETKILETVDVSIQPNSGSNKVTHTDTVISSKYIIGYV
jgi:hypothetical protein